MKKLEIKETRNYQGQDMDWTETFVGKETLEAGTKVYHASDSKIASFFPKTTCFFDSIRASGYVYELEVLEVIEADIFQNGEEYRIDLEKNKAKVAIRYSGHRELVTTFDTTPELDWYGHEKGYDHYNKDGEKMYRHTSYIFTQN